MMKFNTKMALLLACSFYTNLASATNNSDDDKLSASEQQIVAAIEDSFASELIFLEKIVNINSGTRNKTGVRKVGQVFMDEFSKLGFTNQWIKMPEEMDRAGHMLSEQSFSATKKSSKGKKLLLMGHIDTVFPIDSPFQQFTRSAELNGNKISGPGITDMKDGDTVILFALKALINGGFINNGHISVFFTGDEESAGRPISKSRGALINVAKRSDLALNFESGSPDQAVVGRRGSSNWKLTVSGKRYHSSEIFSDNVGAGAIFETSRILNEFYEQVRGEHGLTFNPGVIAGGTFVTEGDDGASFDAYGKTNVVAQKVVVKGGLRFMTEDQKQRAREKMRKILMHPRPQTDATIEFEDSYTAMTATDENRNEMKKLSLVGIALGMQPLTAYDPTKRGAADISFVAPYVTSLDALGAWGGGGHTPGEWLDQRTLNLATKRAAIYIYRLMNEHQ